jgi:hypothetical protein
MDIGAILDVSRWNDPDYLKETGAGNGWSSLWCRLCGLRGDNVTNMIDKSTIRGTRDPWICDKCKKESISNG